MRTRTAFARYDIDESDADAIDEMIALVEEHHSDEVFAAERKIRSMLENIPGGIVALSNYQAQLLAERSEIHKACYLVGRRSATSKYPASTSKA